MQQVERGICQGMRDPGCPQVIRLKVGIAALQNLLKSVYDRVLFGSCFIERRLKPGLTHSPQAYLSAELAVVLFNNTTIARG